MESLSRKPKSLNSCSSQWYVVQSKPREEIRAKYFLEDKGFQTYLPHMEVVITRNFRSRAKKKPLFPTYLFCLFDPETSLSHVRWTKGVAKILPESVSPVPIDLTLVKAIRNLEQEDGIIRKRELKRNDFVRITRGPLKDISGVFQHWASDRGRVRVLLSFIAYQASVELHHSFIERAF